MHKKTIFFAGLLFLFAGVFFFWRLAEEANMAGNTANPFEKDPALMEIIGVDMRHGEKGKELWRLKADAAVMSRHDGGIVAQNPFLAYYYKDGGLSASRDKSGVIVVRSESGDINQRDNRIAFIGQVRVSREQDLLETSRIVYEGKESRLICPQPSQISRPGLRGTADEMMVNLEDNTWHARKNVRVEFDTRRSVRRGGRP
ncbi:MAG: LPS export ABC transporter periplasmic protein LptC [Deltaproteobacteria bacterium]|jgi:LPS export ABC transporter protein LptC|nr:LPS export ABC transporter periplasmic protein LptC [Deltaproteobacteria bacterium]